MGTAGRPPNVPVFGPRSSEFGHLAVRGGDPYLLWPEVHEDGDPVLDPDDHTEPVLIVGHPIVYGELLGGRVGRRRSEWARGQMTSRGGASWLHLSTILPPGPPRRHYRPISRDLCNDLPDRRTLSRGHLSECAPGAGKSGDRNAPSRPRFATVTIRLPGLRRPAHHSASRAVASAVSSAGAVPRDGGISGGQVVCGKKSHVLESAVAEL